MFFEGQDPYLNGLSGQSFPQPPLLFIAGERSLRVFALGENERPSGSSPVYTAPYYNTTTSGVCLGSMPLPAALSTDDTDAYSDAFFHSAFTHGTSQRLLRGWGGSYGELWTTAQESGTLPMQHLVPLEKGVGEVTNPYSDTPGFLRAAFRPWVSAEWPRVCAASSGRSARGKRPAA